MILFLSYYLQCLFSAWTIFYLADHSEPQFLLYIIKTEMMGVREAKFALLFDEPQGAINESVRNSHIGQGAAFPWIPIFQ